MNCESLNSGSRQRLRSSGRNLLTVPPQAALSVGRQHQYPSYLPSHPSRRCVFIIFLQFLLLINIYPTHFLSQRGFFYCLNAASVLNFDLSHFNSLITIVLIFPPFIFQTNLFYTSLCIFLLYLNHYCVSLHIVEYKLKSNMSWNNPKSEFNHQGHIREVRHQRVRL